MIKIVTVCGNGIGSSLLLRMKVEAIAKDLGIEVEAESCDSNAAVGKGADLYLSLIHISEPTRLRRSRMPSSA